MKKGIILAILICMTLGVFAFIFVRKASIYPYKSYQDAVIKELNSMQERNQGMTPKILSGQKFKFDGFISIGKRNANLWKTLPFGGFMTPFPYKNPHYDFHPIITHQGKGKSPVLGYSLKSIEEKRERLRVTLGTSFIFDYYLKGPERPELLKIPVIERSLAKKGPAQIWKDFFLKDISKTNVSFLDLAYNYYIFKLRRKYLPENIKSISYYEKEKVGVIEYYSKDLNYRREMIWQLSGRQVYSYEIKFLADDLMAFSARRKIINNMKYQDYIKDIAKDTYLHYLKLQYREKIGQEGLAYLFSVFSQAPLNQDILRQMIQFLERGKDNLAYLEPMYSYALKQFGKSLSIKDERQEARIQDQEFKDIEARQDNLRQPAHSFSSEEEKILHYLQNAKKKKNLDLKKKQVLIQ